MFESRRNQAAHTGYRALLWALVAIVATAYYLDSAPYVLETDVETSDGIEITRQAESDVLIVIDYDAIGNSGPGFAERDFSVAWINLFEQEIGPVSIATPSSLSMDVLDASRVVVLTASVSDQVPETLLKKLRQHALDGNTVVVERPEGTLRETFSANGRAGSRGGLKLTFSRGLANAYADELLEMPLSTQFIGSTAPRDGATTHLSIDGAPAIYAAPIGEGTAITVDFDLGEQLVALQQGRPDDDFGVAATGHQATPRTSDLIMDPALRTNPVPYADLLERFIVYGVIGEYTPLPGFWLFPGGADGALVAIHEDQSLGDGGGWMLDYETDHRAVSTLFSTVDAGLSASGAAIIHRMGGEAGLAWKKDGTPLELTERIGVGELQPLARPVSLSAQIDQLEDTLPSGSVRSTRIAGSWWDTSWAKPFESMAAEDLRIDTSYTPAPGSGYAFGTGFPFLVVNEQGQPLGIRELPIVYPSGVTEGPELAELIEASQAGHHQAITWAVDSAIFADFPDMERFEKWLGVFDLASQHNHIITNVTRFDNFLRLRRAGRIQSRVVRDAKLPHSKSLEDAAIAAASDDPDDAPEPRAKSATLLRLNVEAKRRGMSLTVPASLYGGSFRLARKGGSRVGGEMVSGDIETVPAEMVGYSFRRIPLDAGFNSIDVYYR